MGDGEFVTFGTSSVPVDYEIIEPMTSVTGPALGSRRDLEASWSRWMQDRTATASREVVVKSWERCSHVVTPDIAQAPIDHTGDAVRQWEDSTVSRAAVTVFDDLREACDDHDFVAAITDGDGTIVWSAGGRQMRRRAERVNFVLGGRWDEASAGTNALGLALRTAKPSTVFSAEHFAPMVHDWVCYSAPIIDPVSRRPVGVVDLSTVWRKQNPLGLTTVRSVARCVELSLATGRSTTTSSTRRLRLKTLGRASAELDGRPLLLSPRQLELATILTLFPDGLTLDALQCHLYGDRPVAASTVKAEVSYLRKAIGGCLQARPYRFTLPVDSDHNELIDHLSHGRLSEALSLYDGRLLPLSEAPAIIERRHYLDTALRAAVIERGGVNDMWTFSQRERDDEWLHEQVLNALGPNDPRHPLVLAQLAVLANA